MDSLVIVNAYTDIFTQAGTYGYTGNLLNLLASVYLYRCIYIYVFVYMWPCAAPLGYIYT